MECRYAKHGYWDQATMAMVECPFSCPVVCAPEEMRCEERDENSKEPFLVSCQSEWEVVQGSQISVSKLSNGKAAHFISKSDIEHDGRYGLLFEFQS